MGTIQFVSGQILFDSGSIAMDAGCCCGDECAQCDSHPLYYFVESVWNGTPAYYFCLAYISDCCWRGTAPNDTVYLLIYADGAWKYYYQFQPASPLIDCSNYDTTKSGQGTLITFDCDSGGSFSWSGGGNTMVDTLTPDDGALCPDSGEY